MATSENTAARPASATSTDEQDAIHQLDTMPFDPVLTQEEYKALGGKFNEMGARFRLLAGILTLSRPKAVALLKSIQTDSGDDEVMKICDNARGLSEWLDATKELAEVIEARLMIVGHEVFGLSWEETAPDPSPEKAAWSAALAEYRAAWAQWATLPKNYSDEQSDAVAAVAFPAFDTLLATPAPDLSAVLIKMEAVSPDGDKDQIPISEFRAIQADVERLAAAA